MKLKIKHTDTFHSSIERAFKAPILGDATKFLNGYRFQPPVTGFEDDDTWGQVDGLRYPVTDGNFWIPKGRMFTDKVLERTENQSWKWMIYDFNIPILFFAKKAVGEWKAIEKEAREIDVSYTYTFYTKNIVCYLVAIIFCQIQWNGMMKKALKGIKEQAESGAGFVYK